MTIKESKPQKIISVVFREIVFVEALESDFVCEKCFGVSSDKKKRANTCADDFMSLEIYAWKKK